MDYQNDLYTEFMYSTQYSGGQWMQGLKNRRDAEWLLFQTGYMQSLGMYVPEGGSGTINPDGLILPFSVEPDVSSEFGWRGGEQHIGTDFRLPIGNEIYATHDGVVTWVQTGEGGGYPYFQGTLRSYGNAVEIKSANGKFSTIYGNKVILISQLCFLF